MRSLFGGSDASAERVADSAGAGSGDAASGGREPEAAGRPTPDEVLSELLAHIQSRYGVNIAESELIGRLDNLGALARHVASGAP